MVFGELVERAFGRTAPWLLGSLVMGGCAIQAGPEGGDELGASTDPVTSVEQSDPKRQTIGNCWLYAFAGWAESLSETATGKPAPNLSESYWTYWHWFEQVANGGASSIATGGTFATASELADRYGIANEGDFIPEESNEIGSARQARALRLINESLKTGALKDSTARRNRQTVRAELDKAFELSPTVVDTLNRVFGAGVTRTLDRRPQSAAGSFVRTVSAFPVAWKDVRGTLVRVSMREAIGQRSAWGGARTGTYAWRTIAYPGGSWSRRQVQKRVQRALHAHAPVQISWFVDFNALGPNGFEAAPDEPGSQGGHLVVMHDYEVENVPGFGTLPAGVDETRASALNAALDDRASIRFFRIKNSWGLARPSLHFSNPDGYHDLYLGYLNGPVSRCKLDANDQPVKPLQCSDTVPLQNFILPPGY